MSCPIHWRQLSSFSYACVGVLVKLCSCRRAIGIANPPPSSSIRLPQRIATNYQLIYLDLLYSFHQSSHFQFHRKRVRWRLITVTWPLFLPLVSPPSLPPNHSYSSAPAVFFINGKGGPISCVLSLDWSISLARRRAYSCSP